MAAAEERHHLLADGAITIAMGLLTPVLGYGFLWFILTYPGRRFGFGSDVELVLFLAIAVIFTVAFIISWRQVQPLAANDKRSEDPRYGRPKARANEADDESVTSDYGFMTWGVLLNGATLSEIFLTVGSRSVVQGIRSLVERSRLSESRLLAAATLLISAGAEGGLASASIPGDPATLDALTFLWRNRYLKADGVLSRTRLHPSIKGLEALGRGPVA